MKLKKICISVAIVAWCTVAFFFLASDNETISLAAFFWTKFFSLVALLLGACAWHEAEKRNLIIDIKIKTEEL